MHGYNSPVAACLVAACLALLLFGVAARAPLSSEPAASADLATTVSSRSPAPVLNLPRFTLEAKTPGAPRVLRVLAARSQHVRATLSPYGPGFERELVEDFANRHGYTVFWLAPRSPQAAWQALAKGEADLFIGMGFEPEGAWSAPVHAGPAYITAQPVVVSARRHGGGGVLRQPGENLRAVGAQLAVSELGRELTAVVEASQQTTVADDMRLKLWEPFYPEVDAAAFALPETTEPYALTYRWYWSERKPALARALARFWREPQLQARLEELRERYYGFLEERADPYETRHLVRTVREASARYGEAVANASREIGVDPLLFTAMIYQESHFNPHAVSPTGVRGLLQITGATARELQVNRLDPLQSIEGGARYLHQLWEELETWELTPWDRWFFALAAYNQGFGNLERAVRLAQARGGEGRTWRELKAVYPAVGHGCRGHEAVRYVERIRRYYYTLYGLVLAARPEVEDFGALAALSEFGVVGVGPVM